MIINSSISVFGQCFEKRRPEKFNHWSKWKIDSTQIETGFVIVKKRQKYSNKRNGYKYQTITSTYDVCNNLTHKIKEDYCITCFGGKNRIIYDRNYKSNCTKH